MNEQDLRRVLTDIAAQEIPDTMDIWQDIHNQLDKPKTKRKGIPRRRYIGAWIAIIIGIAVAISVATNSSPQPRIYASGDAGIIAANKADLMLPLNLVEKIEDKDIYVLVPWAYADGHRISIQYHVDHDATLDVPPLMTVTLKDKAGKNFPPPAFIRGGGGGGGGDADRVSFGSTFSFDASSITGNPDQLDLVLELQFTRDPAQTNSGGGGGSGGSGGGGGGSGDGLPDATPVAKTPVAPFNVEFSFSVPFIPADKINEAISATVNGVTMTLDNISYAPSVTLSRLCFIPPMTDSVWTPSQSAFLDESLQGDTVVDFIPYAPLDDPAEICGQLVVMGEQPQGQTLTLQIARLISDPIFTPSRITEFELDLEAQGFGVELAPSDTSSFSFSLSKIPEKLGDNYYDVVNRIYEESFYEVIEGPWEFTIDLAQ
jgi:hypothetical protein